MLGAEQESPPPGACQHHQEVQHQSSDEPGGGRVARHGPQPRDVDARKEDPQQRNADGCLDDRGDKPAGGSAGTVFWCGVHVMERGAFILPWGYGRQGLRQRDHRITRANDKTYVDVSASVP